VADPESAARAGLLRSMAIYTAFLIPAVAVAYYIASAGPHGVGYLTLTIAGVLSLMLAYQVVQHYRDLRAPLVETVGTIQRKWTRADLIIAWQSFYFVIDRTVFRVRPEDYLNPDFNEGAMVKVVHFPHTLNVVSVHALKPPPSDPSARI
jgi:hypothetical protein